MLPAALPAPDLTSKKKCGGKHLETTTLDFTYIDHNGGSHALPAPDMTSKKKRGGKRARAIKDKYAQTEMQKQAARIQFGVQRGSAIKDKYAETEMQKQATRDVPWNALSFLSVNMFKEDETIYGDETKGMGSLGKHTHGGKIKVQKKEVKLLNRQAKERNGLTSAVKGQNHGLVSSVVMNTTSGKGQNHGLVSSVVMDSTPGMVFEQMTSDGSGT
ncbi:Prp31 C terminal domain-containing protein, partial [Baffinella frigidus]